MIFFFINIQWKTVSSRPDGSVFLVFHNNLVLGTLMQNCDDVFFCVINKFWGEYVQGADITRWFIWKTKAQTFMTCRYFWIMVGRLIRVPYISSSIRYAVIFERSTSETKSRR